MIWTYCNGEWVGKDVAGARWFRIIIIPTLGVLRTGRWCTMRRRADIGEIPPDDIDVKQIILNRIVQECHRSKGMALQDIGPDLERVEDLWTNKRLIREARKALGQK